jgi:hypothetical protein
MGSSGKQAGILISTILLAITGADAQQLPLPRRVLSLAPGFYESVEEKVVPPEIPKASGTVLIVYRTSEQGRVLDAMAVNGPALLRQAAVDAVKQWKLKPHSANGQPLQVHSAVILNFSRSPVSIEMPKPMTAEQISPELHAKCLSGILNNDSLSVDLCRQQLSEVEHNGGGTPMNRLAAHDEYGLALLLFAHQPKEALEQFKLAVQFAPQGLKQTDAEWAYVYWHRARAEQLTGYIAQALEDFETAENSMHDAAGMIGDERMSGYYQRLLQTLLQEHAAVLDNDNRHPEVQRVLDKFQK